MTILEEFIDDLSSVSTIPNRLYNFYSGSHGKKRIENLRAYLLEMVEIKPRILLVGEAAGPHGCARTGIPFTDEITLSSAPVTVRHQRIFVNTYHIQIDGHGPVPEDSAEAMWEAIKESGQLPLLWNSFPYFPGKNPDGTIRNPNVTEVREFSSRFIPNLLEFFPGVEYFGAVGRLAQVGIVEALGFPPYIEHPSRQRNKFRASAIAYLSQH